MNLVKAGPYIVNLDKVLWLENREDFIKVKFVEDRVLILERAEAKEFLGNVRLLGKP